MGNMLSGFKLPTVDLSVVEAWN